MTSLPRARQAPTLAGWAFAVVSLSAAIAAAGVGGFAVSHGDLLRMKNELSTALAMKDFGRAKRAVGALAQDRGVEQYLVPEELRLRRLAATQAASDLLDLVSLARTGDTTLLDPFVERVTKAMDDSTLAGSGAVERWTSSIPLWEEFAALSARDAAQSGDVDRSMAERRAVRASFNETRARFARLVGLPTPASLPDQIETLPIYRSGALSGIPQIAEIPDGLSDFVALKVVLDKLGARVSTSGPQAYELFTTELEAIRSKASELEQRESAAVKLLTDQQSSRRDIQERMKRHTARLTAGAVEILGMLAECF